MKQIITLLLLTITLHLSAQQFHWVKRAGGAAREVYSGTCFDLQGNIYNVGYFGGTISFTQSATTLSSKGKTDVYFTKYDSNGALIWAKQIAGTNDEDCSKIALLEDGTLLLYGRFKGTIDFDPGDGETLLTAVGTGYNAFLATFDTDGQFIRANVFPGTGDVSFEDMLVDEGGNIFLKGRFKGTVDFDPDPNVTNNKTSTGTFNSYLLKLDAEGTFQWMKHFAGTDALASDLFIYDNSIYYVGQFQGSMILYPENTPSVSSKGVNDLFITKFSTDGVLDTLIAYGTPRNDEFTGVLVTASGIYLSGTFIDEIDINPNPGAEDLLLSNGTVDAFLLALDSNFNFRWAQHFGGIEYDLSSWILQGPNQTFYYLLKYNETTTLDILGQPEVLTAASTDATDSAILTVDETAGTILAVYEIKGTGEEYPVLYEYPGDDMLLSGAFEETTDFDYTPSGDHSLVAMGFFDSFLMRFRLGMSTAVFELPKSNSLTLFPVPVHTGEILNIGLSNFNGVVQIYDSFGRLTYNTALGENNLKVPQELPSGVYYLIAIDESGFHHTGSFMVK